MKEHKALIGYAVFVGLLAAAILTSPFWAWSASTYTDKFSLEMPERGDVGWDDAIRINHKIFEVVTTPILEGNFVVTGCTLHAGSGLTVYWDAGWLKFSGVSKYLPSGATTIANNTINWISAITPYVSGATVDNRATEYYPPSGASGFAYIPIGLAVAEAGTIARLKDFRHMQRTALTHDIDQDVDSGASPTFAKVYVTNDVDSGSINARSGLTPPVAANPAPTAQGQIAYSTNMDAVVTGDGTNTRAIMSGHTETWIIASPDLLDDPNNQIIYRNRTGTTWVITNAFFAVDETASPAGGVTVDCVSGASKRNYKFATGTTIFGDVKIDTAGGVSLYYEEYTSGSTSIPPDFPIIINFGDASTADWLEITFGGYLEGNKP